VKNLLDWLTFYDQLIGYVKIATSAAIMVLIGIAAMAYILRSRKLAIDAAIVAVALLIIATVLARYGVEILPDEVYEFFGGLFSGVFLR
jgi:hypothetical protein